MLTSFEDYRDRMLSIMAEAEKRLSHDVPPDTDALDLARTRMSRIFTAFHLFADREFFCAAAMAAEDPAQCARLKALSGECATLAGDFRAFTRDCVTRPVIHRWASYRMDARTMMARLRQHIAAMDTATAGRRTLARTAYRSAA
jgi:hypothetical protein